MNGNIERPLQNSQVALFAPFTFRQRRLRLETEVKSAIE